MFFLLPVLIFLISCHPPLLAQQKKASQKFTHYTTRMGLSSSYQQCIVQDNEGFIWIGTIDGLNRFDGNSFKVYRRIHNDSTSLQSNLITELLVDSENVLWVGTSRGGLSRYNKETDNFTNYISEFHDNTTLSNNVVTAIAEDAYQQLWIGTYKGLSLFDRKTNRFVRFNHMPTDPFSQHGIAFDQIRSFTLEGDNLWIAYSSGIISSLDVKKKTFTHYKLFDITDRNVKEFMVTSICKDGDLFWISTWGNGVWTFNRNTGSCKPFRKISHEFINQIFKDRSNVIWVATESDGLIQLDQSRTILTEFRHDDFDDHSLSNNSIARIFQDRQDNLWLCSKKGGLHYMITNNPFRVWRRNPTNPEELSDNHITCVLEDHKRRLWVGYLNGGIEIFDLNGRSEKVSLSKDSKTGIGYGTVVSIFQSRDKTIWVGTYLDGLKKYDDRSGTFVSYVHDPGNTNSISCNSIRQIAEDSRGNLWLATHGGGLDKFDPINETFTHHRVDYANTSNTINSDWLLSVICDKDDNIWVGSVSGITVLNSKAKVKQHYYYQPDYVSLSNDNVNSILQDADGIFWIATNDGLNRLDYRTGAVRVYTTEDGLPNNLILGILEDDHRNLWISTGKGLSKFSIGNETFKNYFTEDGLESDEFMVASCFKNARGEMYFGAREGLNLFHPDSLKTSTFNPPVYISDFKLFNQSVEIRSGETGVFSLAKQIRFTPKLTLNYDQNIIGFDFVALDYRNPGRNQFTYIMEGFDKDWSKPGNRHEVTYTNLHPGKYTFRVKAANADGVWSENETSIDITIEPPFWKTNWAFMFYIAFIILLMYGFRVLILRHAAIIRKLELEELEIEKLHEMDTQKMHFFSNVSHEFRTPLTLIAGPLENLMKTCRDEFQQTQLNIIHRNSKRLLRLINQLMDFRKLETNGLKLELDKHDIIKFVRVVTNAFTLEARQRNIDFTLITKTSSLIAWFDRDKLEKVLFNLIGNAFKFTPDSGKIVVRVMHESRNNFEHAIRIIVEDSGIGIPKESLTRIFDRFYQAGNTSSSHGTGIGLALAKELTELHGGHIKAESELGLGSRFTIVIPLQIETRGGCVIDSGGEDFIHEGESSVLPEEVVHKTDDANESKPLLLIIEDNHDMRFYIKNEFKDYYRIIDAADGVSGLEKAAAESPDAILCDVMMSRMDGITLCKELKKDIHTSHIPVILLTARSSEEHTLIGLESGADDYVSKPFNPSILRVKVKNLVELRKTLHKRFQEEPEASIRDISPSCTDEKFLKKVYEIVEKNLGNADFDAADFAMEIGMSRAQLYRKIQGITGQSVKEFIRIIRLKKAAEMLISADMNISQIAFEVGFNSVAYFTKSFSDYFEVTPTKYISLNKESKRKPAAPKT